MGALTYADLNERVGKLMATHRGEWCGVPIPLPGLRLHVEQRNPWATAMAALQSTVDGDEVVPREEENVLSASAFIDGDDDTGWVSVNQWWSHRLRRYIGIAKNVTTGASSWYGGKYDYVRKTTLVIDTLRAAQIWPLDAELKAIDTLATHLSHRPHLFEAYVCTGTFLETSARSQLTYIFRRCRPTLVYNARTSKVLCALCLHPIGYYGDTHAGSMVPTDDVIAHLLLMRGDEPLLWRRANQHPLDHPEAGL